MQEEGDMQKLPKSSKTFYHDLMFDQLVRLINFLDKVGGLKPIFMTLTSL
jgi:hypothetical protein